MGGIGKTNKNPVIIITLPEKVSTNKIYAGIHYRTRTKLADLYHWEMIEYKNKIKIKKYPVIITYTFHFRKNALDSLNCAFMAKMIEDGLVGADVLKDDTPAYVFESRLRSKLSKEYEHDTVVIEITPI